MNTTTSASSPPTIPKDCSTDFLRQRSTTVLVRETATGRYLQNGGLWTLDIRQATAFPSGSSAMTAVTRNQLSHVQLVLTREYAITEVIPITTLSWQ